MSHSSPTRRGAAQQCRFSSTAELAEAFTSGASGPFLGLSLYSPAMGGAVAIRRIELDREKFPTNSWRFEAAGWGLIQLNLRGLHEGRIYPSHTNHNSEGRALTWHDAYPQLGEPSAWHWREVANLSRRLNRFLHRIAAFKSGSRPVLPGAAARVRSGQAQLALA